MPINVQNAEECDATRSSIKLFCLVNKLSAHVILAHPLCVNPNQYLYYHQYSMYVFRHDTCIAADDGKVQNNIKQVGERTNDGIFDDGRFDGGVFTDGYIRANDRIFDGAAFANANRLNDYRIFIRLRRHDRAAKFF